MQGVILSAGAAQGTILGDDGTRYTFTPLGWRDEGTPPAVGMRVDFEPRGSHAVGIYPILGVAPTPTGTPAVHPDRPTGALPTAPGVSPTVSGGPPTQPPPPPPAQSPPLEKGGFGAAWWHWALAGGGVVVILGIVGAVALGVFRSSGSPIGEEPPREPMAAQPAPTAWPTTPTPIPTSTPVPITEVNFTGLVTSTNPPSQVQVAFSLRDQEEHAIVRPAEQVEQGVKVFERGTGTGGEWEEIDYRETSFFVQTAENIDLEIVFVLDFTNSMSQARLSDGRNGIQAMLDAFEASLAVLSSAHRVGVVEFHDRNAKPSVLSPLTTDRQAALSAAQAFLLTSGFDSGASRVWDSLVTASDLFSSRSQNPRAVRALVFLSDGRDTSSENTREQAARYASERGVQLYAMGVGDVFQESELRSAARSTEGAYYPARDLNLIQQQLQLLVNDLRGQYQLTYITLRRTGEYRVRLVLELTGVVGETQVGPFDVARFFGADNQGVIEFDTPSLDRAGQRATVFMRAQHVPRNIDRIRFRPETTKPLTVDLVPSKDGGLLEGWSLSGPDADGWYEAFSGTPLEFGSLGLLTKLTILNLTEDFTKDFLRIPIEFDNGIYTGGKGFSSTTIVMGSPP